ncbi:MAG TPA: hypothetical protein VFL17_02085 [Anaerolineae bacterium]|nr:hypothetical protein [Anaerolineae bacterium]
MKLNVLLPLLVTLLVAPFAMADSAIAEGTALATDSVLTDSSITADATISATTDTTTTLTTTFGTRKFRPGHYIALLLCCDSQAVMAASMKPGVVGFMKRYTWRSLEPTLGAYNFSELQSDLYWAAAYGMNLVVMIDDKSFKLNEKHTPAYLDKYALRNRQGGFTAARWQPYVVQRMNALTKALGNRFDSNRALEGVIITEETAPGVDNWILDANGYTPEKYRDAYISMLNAASASLPTSRIFWYMNFLPRNQSYLADIAAAVASKGVVLGGPDVIPDKASLQQVPYPIYRKMHGKMPKFGQIEGACYMAPHLTTGYSTKYWSPAQLFQYAKNDLKVNYMFWVRIPRRAYPESYIWLDALPTINYHSPFSPS